MVVEESVRVGTKFLIKHTSTRTNCSDQDEYLFGFGKLWLSFSHAISTERERVYINIMYSSDFQDIP